MNALFCELYLERGQLRVDAGKLALDGLHSVNPRGRQHVGHRGPRSLSGQHSQTYGHVKTHKDTSEDLERTNETGEVGFTARAASSSLHFISTGSSGNEHVAVTAARTFRIKYLYLLLFEKSPYFPIFSLWP